MLSQNTLATAFRGVDEGAAPAVQVRVIRIYQAQADGVGREASVREII
jgi:hypothetical protein